MKHLLNNLTEQEKNSIREQHTGGMRVSNNRFKALLENKLGNAKPLVEKFDDDDNFNFEDEELYRGAPERLVKHKNGKIVGTHKHGVGYTPNEHGIRLGHSSHPTSIPNFTKFDDEDDYDFEDEELYSGAPERLVKHMDSGKIVGTHKHGVGYTPNKHGIRLGHSSHPTSIPNFTKFDDEDDYDFEYNTDSINEQDFSLSGVPVSASYSGSSNTPVKRYNVSTPVSGSTTSSPAREQVVNDCFRQIYYVMAIDKQTLFDRAKTTKHNKELFANGEIPTEEEWSLAEEKFMMINMKGVFNLD